MDFRLKGALVAKFGTQTEAAKAIGVSERRLSRIIHGHELPRPAEIKLFRERLGVRLELEQQGAR